jgi:hypothetical protein
MGTDTISCYGFEIVVGLINLSNTYCGEESSDDCWISTDEDLENAADSESS